VDFIGDSKVKGREEHDLMTRHEAVLRNITSLERKLSNGGLSGERKRCYLSQLEKLRKSQMKILAIIRDS